MTFCSMKLGRSKKLGLLLMAMSCLTEKVVAEEEIVCRDYKTWPAHENAFQPCYYVGAGLGLSTLEPDTSNSSWSADDDGDQGLKLFGGYHFTPRWFVEGVVADLGEISLSNAHPFITSAETIQYESMALYGGYYFPLERWFSTDLPLRIFVKGGMSKLSSESGSALIKLDKSSSTQLSTGAGLEWQLDREWMLRGEVESIAKDIQLMSVSVAYWFGGKKHYYEIEKVIPVEPKVEPLPVPVVPPAEDTTTIVMLDAQRLDLDKDGVPDEHDICNNTPPGLVVNAKGCAVYQGALEGVQVEVNSTQLTAESKGRLEKIVSILRNAPDTFVEIQAHTDSDGSDEYNMKLSMRRGETVRNYLVSKGILENHLRIKGFGESRPIDTNDTDEGKKNNRRVDFKIVE